MTTAIDFGCYEIRSAQFANDQRQLLLRRERSEYIVLPNEPVFEETITTSRVPSAICEDTLVVFGNRVADVRWLSRRPAAPLFTDGQLPTSDAPARQILNVLTEALLPKSNTSDGRCCFLAPQSGTRKQTVEFLSRLIRMNGFEPQLCSATEAVTLACGCESGFTGISICMGTEVTEVGISRFGQELVHHTIDVGSNWIDAEFARQLKLQVWDENGDCFLDIETVRDWKVSEDVHLSRAEDDRQRTLARLYGVVLDRIAGTVRRLIDTPVVSDAIKDVRLKVLCCGGPTLISGFTAALTEKFVEQETAARISAVQVIDDPVEATLRGLLIRGELEARLNPNRSAA
ncbi:MAG: hypothetical protein Fues2KO_25880 [Fuerstiella sp.]